MDGLQLNSESSKAALIRQGVVEMIRFCGQFQSTEEETETGEETREETEGEKAVYEMYEIFNYACITETVLMSCGIADVIASSYGVGLTSTPLHPFPPPTASTLHLSLTLLLWRLHP